MNDTIPSTELRKIVAEHPLFRGLEARHVDLVTEPACDQSFARGAVLFRQGDPAAQFYLIVSGRVLIEAHRAGKGNAPVQVVGPGEALGWSWLFPPFVWHFQARAVEPSQVVVLDGATLLVAAEEDPRFGYELMKRVVQVLVHRLEAARQRIVSLQFPRQPGA